MPTHKASGEPLAVIQGIDATTGLPTDINVISNAASVEPTHQAGERHSDDSDISYLVVQKEYDGIILSAGITSKTVSSAPCRLGGIYIHTALVGTLTLTGGSDELGAAATYVIPAGTVGFINLLGERYETTLVAQKSSASDDGKIKLLVRAI